MAGSVLTTMSVIATTPKRVKDLVIKDGQLIFVRDEETNNGTVFFDFKGTRTIYNQIIELESDLARISLSSPIGGRFYFVIENATLWYYSDTDKWVQITSTSDSAVFIGDLLPEIGQQKTIYVDKSKKEISVWDDTGSNYMVVADKTDNAIKTVTDEDINILF